ncbi:transposable element Tcb2 transposase [Trichonephila clavipes]|nr:transposable element Tcb2 transposase [Trichonephila clavipes]
MSERGETDSRSIGSSDKFRTTAVRRNVVNHQTRFQRTGDVTQHPVSGRPRVITPRQDRYLVISARRQRGSTARALGSALTVASGIRISRQTVYRRLNHAGLYARRPAVCIAPTSVHKRIRLNWSLKHQHIGEWANVMFSDESRFSLSSDSRRVTICLMFTCFEVLSTPDFIFMDDNVSCHRVVLIDDFVETENIQRMSWPANSPGLNPIKNVWDVLGRQIATLSYPPSSITELKRVLQEAWNRLSPQLIHHLIVKVNQEVSHGSNRSNQGHFKEQRFCNARESEMCQSKSGNRLMSGPDCMVDALKLPNQAPRVSGESLQMSVAWRFPVGTQHLFCWPVLSVFG